MVIKSSFFVFSSVRWSGVVLVEIIRWEMDVLVIGVVGNLWVIGGEV